MKELSEQTYYEVLELAPGCAADVLLKAYALAKERYGPGALATYALAEPGEAEALLRRVEEAFAVLSDPDRRQAYDTAGGYPSGAREGVPERISSPPTEPEPAAGEPLQPLATEPERKVAEQQPAAEPAVELKPAPEVPMAEPAVAPALEAKGEPPSKASERPPDAVALASPEPLPEPPRAPSAEPSPPPEPLIERRSEPEAEPMPPKAEQRASEPEHKPVRKTESDLPADAAVTGDALRRVREARGLTLKDVESRTKIGRWHLENIERERFADLPAQVYLRGFLMSLARELKLDPVRVARSYLEQMKTKPQAKPE